MLRSILSSVTALYVLSVIVESNRPVSEVTHLFEPVPQILRNIRLNASNALQNPRVMAAIYDAEQTLGSRGQLLIRKSGTESLFRFMAQGYDADQINSVLTSIIDTCYQEQLVDPITS